MDSILLSLSRAPDLTAPVKERCPRWRVLRPVSVGNVVLFLYGADRGGILCGVSRQLEITSERPLVFVTARSCVGGCGYGFRTAVFDSVLPGNSRRGR